MLEFVFHLAIWRKLEYPTSYHKKYWTNLYQISGLVDVGGGD